MSAIWVQADETDEGTLWMIGCSNCGFEDEAYSEEEAHFTVFVHEDECDAAAALGGDPMSGAITLRDVDNRDCDGAPYEFTGSAEQVIGYLDGPLRGDLRDHGSAWLDAAIAAVRADDLAKANELLNRNAVVYLAAAGREAPTRKYQEGNEQ